MKTPGEYGHQAASTIGVCDDERAALRGHTPHCETIARAAMGAYDEAIGLAVWKCRNLASAQLVGRAAHGAHLCANAIVALERVGT